MSELKNIGAVLWSLFTDKPLPPKPADETPQVDLPEPPTNIRTVHAVWPFEGDVTIEIEDGIPYGVIGIEIRRPGNEFLTVTVPKDEFLFALRAADGDDLAAHHLRFLRETR